MFFRGNINLGLVLPKLKCVGFCGICLFFLQTKHRRGEEFGRCFDSPNLDNAGTSGLGRALKISVSSDMCTNIIVANQNNHVSVTHTQLTVKYYCMDNWVKECHALILTFLGSGCHRYSKYCLLL